jgi:hypothetical protein
MTMDFRTSMIVSGVIGNGRMGMNNLGYLKLVESVVVSDESEGSIPSPRTYAGGGE